jgi:GNAT superfamily N-acetyltransferase
MAEVLRVLDPASPLHEAALDHTFPFWNDGLSRERYGRFNRAQMQTRWGARGLRRVGLVDGDRLLASAKRYQIELSIDGAPTRVLGIGAVFTPKAMRGRGYARRLIERLVGEAATDGAGAALLFSEIGTAYYEGLGFRTVPLRDVEIRVVERPGAPAMLVRTVEDQDLPFIADLHNAMSAGYRFSQRYDADWLAYGLSKKRMLAAFVPAGQRLVECFVAEEGGRPVAWVLMQVTGRDTDGYQESWSLEACGDRDPSGARIGAMLQALIARTPAAARPLIRAWWPARLAPPQLELHPRPPSAVTMMVRPFAPGALATPPGGDDVFYWHGDAF